MKRTPDTVGEANRREFFESIGYVASSVVRGEQVHGDKISVAEGPGICRSTDSLITRNKELLLGISVADCVPVLIIDKRSKTIAAIHAGWRGTAKQIVAKTVEYLLDELHIDPKNLFAFIGPSAGVCCYEVGYEVVAHFPKTFYIEKPELGKYMLDLKRTNAAQLIESGIPASNIDISEACTICDDNFHSFRRDGAASGRMLAVIGVK